MSGHNAWHTKLDQNQAVDEATYEADVDDNDPGMHTIKRRSVKAAVVKELLLDCCHKSVCH